jgi:hypothetical protein
MIDVEEDSVEETGGILRIKARPARRSQGELEEIAMNKATAGIGNETRSERDETTLVPLDDWLKIIDGVERGDRVVFERGPGSVAETETTNDDIEGGGAGKGIRGGGETEMRERLFYFGEETRHQVGVTEDDLVDFEVVEGKDDAAPQDQITQRRLAIVELFEERRRRHRVSYPRIGAIATGMWRDTGTGVMTCSTLPPGADVDVTTTIGLR